MLSEGAPSARDTGLLEADPLSSPLSNRPPTFVCSGDEWATHYYALRHRQWKLILGDPGADDQAHPSISNGVWCTGPPCPAAHNNTRTMAGPFPARGVMLFDVHDDPAETTDMADAQPQVVAKLLAIIEAYNASAVDSRGVCAPGAPHPAPILRSPRPRRRHRRRCWQ